MYIKVRRGYDSLDKGICSLARPFLEKLNIIENQEYTLNVGQLNKKVVIIGHDEKNNNMYFPEEVFHELLLFSELQLNIWLNERDIYLGPVVGVFVQPAYLKAIAENEIPESAEKHMEASGYEHCLTYYFSLENIVWCENKIRGYTYAPRFKKWKRYWFPLPDIVYDRAVNFSNEEKALAKHIRGEFRYNPNIRFINDADYLGKWHLYDHLSQHREIRGWLPETIKYTCFDDVLIMLDKHNRVFLKAYYGSRGIGIMYIERVSEGYIVEFVDKELVNILIKKEDILQKEVESFFEDQKVVVQQGISLARFQDRKFDLRLLLNKGLDGEWKVIYRQARIAKENFNITNSAQGGSVLNYEDIVESTFEVWPGVSELNRKTIELAEYIEKEFGTFGELGMDVAVDGEGKFWFIEANTKPDKNPEVGIENTETPSPQALAIFGYAKFLTKHKIERYREQLNILAIKIKEKRENRDSQVISLPEGLIKKLSLPLELTLRVGLLEESVIIASNSTSDLVEIPTKLMDKLHLHEGLECQILWRSNKLQLGPTIAVFLSNGSIRKINSQRPKFRHIEFFNANSSAKTILYFFSIKDVDFIKGCIKGTYYDAKLKRWLKRCFPFPDIFYDRGGGVLDKQIIKSNFIREQLDKIPTLKRVNPQFYFDKWDTHQRLSKYGEIEGFLPETYAYQTQSDLEAILEKHREIFIKDSLGSNGRGVLKVTKIDTGYEFKYFKGKVISHQVRDTEHLHSLIKSFIPSKNLILQQAINLLKIDDSSVDLRATIQRTGEGHLEIVSLPVRIGCKNSPVTSTQTGSSVEQFESFFKEVLRYSPNEIIELKARVEGFLRSIYDLLEREYGKFGEIGIDFAIDLEGKIWFIECNAKPGYDSMYKAYGEDVIRKTFSNPLEYSKYLWKI